MKIMFLSTLKQQKSDPSQLHSPQHVELKLHNMELRREQAERDAAALAKFQEEQMKAHEKLQNNQRMAEQKFQEVKEKAARVKEAACLKEECFKAIPSMVPMTRQSGCLRQCKQRRERTTLGPSTYCL